MKTKELELYIHIPFCVRKCKYCDFLSFASDNRTQQVYMEALGREIAYYGPLMQAYEVTSIYIGGGTPSWLDLDLILRLLEQLWKHFRIRSDAEVSMECNPGTASKEKLYLCRINGINRLSIGLQSTEAEELQVLGRIHTYEQFLKTFQMARENGFKNINIDLMSGLPGQTVESYAKSLNRVARLKPEHISAYSLIVEEGTPFYDWYAKDVQRQQEGLKPEHLPSEEELCQMLALTNTYLEKERYHRYEISNFARKGYECKHNVGYWTRAEYLGLGLGAASLVGNARFSNTRDLKQYILETGQMRPKAFVDEAGVRACAEGTCLHIEGTALTRQEQMEEFMFLGLRQTKGVSREEFQACFETSMEAVYGDVIRQLMAQGLMESCEGWVRLTEQGLDVSNYAMAQFL